MEAPKLAAIDMETHKFEEPKKKIQEPDDLEKFLHSEACGMLMVFVAKLCTAVEGKSLS